MPEAAVNENDGTMTRQDNIGLTGQPRGVKAKPVAKTMQGCSHDAFGRSILTANRRHAFVALRGCKRVSHECPTLRGRVANRLCP